MLHLSLPPLRDLAATLKGAAINRERYGATYRQEIAAILARDAWSRDRMEEYQSTTVRQLMESASRHVPYYRRHGFPQVLDKETVREDPLAFVDERYSAGRLIEDRTSGTSGTPVRIFMTREAIETNYAFFEARCRRPAGLRYGEDPYIMCGGRHIVPVSRARPPFWCYNFAGKQLYLSAYHLAPQHLGSYCEEIRRRPYRAIMGYPSTISAIAHYAVATGISDLRIPAAITNGEMLYPGQRQAIEKAFGCRVFDQYGSVELAAFAAECGRGTMHVSPDYGKVEILDDQGRPAPAGEVGHLVCTGLINPAQILFRYRVGDMAAWRNEACPCGSPLPALERLEGRASHAFVLADGRRVYRVGVIAENIPRIRECRIVQESIGKFTIEVVADPGFREDDAEELARNLTANVGPASIRIALVERIARGPGGKFAFLVSRVQACYALTSNSGSAFRAITR